MCVLNYLFLTRHLQATGNRSAAGGVVAFLALRCVLSWTRLPALWEKEKSKNRRHAESGVSLLRFSGSCVRRMEWRGRFGWQAGKNSHSYSPHTHPTSEVQWY